MKSSFKNNVFKIELLNLQKKLIDEDFLCINVAYKNDRSDR